MLTGSDYYEELLPSLKDCIGKAGEPVGIKIPLGWTIDGHVLGEVDECQVANHAYMQTLTNELIRKM